jgi:predicted membrane protein (TIGR00267 family)
MKGQTWFRDSRHSLDIVAGLIDGILNALTLAAAKLTAPSALDPLMVAKVATIAACSTSFVFFVAHYAQLRAELIRAARELNLLSHGRLATTQLGRQVFQEAAVGALIASVCGVIGSVIPLLVALLVPSEPRVGLACAIGLLGLFGVLLARQVMGSPYWWSGGLIAGGLLVMAIGIKLNVLN